MTKHAIREGQEDRHGEMTGAITINLILSTVPVGLWCFFIGPWLSSFKVTLLVGLLMAVALPLAFLPPSRRIWAALSNWAQRL